ncbi:sulfite exporter TauE/SafE family protein [Candidatus Daviesbacteria bacterium]|nr:sulfite exporter TauE/SafE family protein [Candidatus Daviesbacteria bacterium]
MESIWIFIAAFIATTISAMSGGGSSIIAVPIFLSMGIVLPMAVAIQSISGVFWVLPSAFNYLKGRKIEWMFLLLFAGIGTIGSYFGALAITSFDQKPLAAIVGLLILFLIGFMNYQKNLGLQEQHVRSKFKERLAYVFSFPMGFYEGFFGSGNGIFFTLVTAYTKGFDFIDALGYYYAVAFPWVVVGALVLISKGYFDLSLMVPAVLGSLVGGYIGSKYARLKGNKFVKITFTIIGIILGLKLLLGI